MAQPEIYTDAYGATGKVKNGVFEPYTSDAKITPQSGEKKSYTYRKVKDSDPAQYEILLNGEPLEGEVVYEDKATLQTRVRELKAQTEEEPTE